MVKTESLDITKPKAWYEVEVGCRKATRTLNIGQSGSGWMSLTLQFMEKIIDFSSHQCHCPNDEPTFCSWPWWIYPHLYWVVSVIEDPPMCF